MEKVRKYLQSVLEENKIAGMAVAITDKEKILFAEGFGVENAERPEVPVTADSLFRIASITKIFTGLTVLGLVEEGKLSLDAPVYEIVPELSLMGDKNKEITLRHLLSHTSGLPKEYTPDGPKEESAMEEVLLEGISKAEFIGEPGKQYQYSNWGIRLASLMAQRVTGKLFSQLAEERVLRPLGTERTTFDLNVAASFPLSLPHFENDGVFSVMHRIQGNATRLAAGGLFSSARDLTKMARFLLNGVTDSGERILGEEMLSEMKTVHFPDADRILSSCLTLFRAKLGERYVFVHRGSAPPYNSSLAVHPESGLGIVTLINTERPPLRLEIPENILNILLG